MLGAHYWEAQRSAKKLRYVRASLESDVSTFIRSIRPVYPYSVIPGGAYSQRELRNSVSSDPVIASHYEGFDVARAVLLKTTAPMLRYISYRQGNRIAWTKKVQRIPKGELVLSDGVSFARARCGNRLSASPVKPAPEDGPDLELSIPDIEAPRPNVPLTPLEELRVPPLTAFSRRSPVNLLSPSESDVGASNPDTGAPTPLGIMPGGFIPEGFIPGAVAVPVRGVPPIVSSSPIPPPANQTAIATVPEPSTRWQVALTFGIALLLMFSFDGTSRRRQRSGS